MKEAKAVIIGLILVLLILIGVGVYYYLNNSNKISPDVTTLNQPIESGRSGQLSSPTVTPGLEDAVNSIQISTDEADILQLKTDANSL